MVRKKRPPKAPTLQSAKRPLLGDVAAAAGVSVVTVSRAMNSPGIVSAKTHKRIESAITAIGYVPDLVARSMAKQRTRIVAGFVPTLLDSIFASTIQGLSDALSRASLQLLLGNTEYDLQREERMVTAIMGRRPDAIALTGNARSAELRRTLRRSGVPVVEMWSIADSPIDMAVGFANRGAARAATSHMLGRGRRRIGFVSRPVAENDRAYERRCGYMEAMREAGITVPTDWIWETETTIDSGREAVDRIALPQQLDGILFSGDNTAAGALLACLNRGIPVPEKIAIAGIGDLPIASALPGGLTSVRIDAYNIGKKAGELLIGSLNGDRPLSRVVDVGFQLIVRGST